MSYIYRADVWCNDCGRANRKRLLHEGKAPAHPEDETDYDSDDFPKRACDNDESDTPEHCAAGEHCLNAITLPSGQKIGFLFGELTLDGIQYVKDSIAEAQEGLGSLEVVELWRQHFTDKGYSI